MRVSPVIDFAKSRDDIIKYATMSAECTHNHQEGIKGAAVTATCGWMAKNGASKRKSKNMQAVNIRLEVTINTQFQCQ